MADDWGLQQSLYPDNNNLMNAEFGKNVAAFDQYISTAYYDHDNYSYPNFPCWQYNIFSKTNNNWELFYSEYTYDDESLCDFNDFQCAQIFKGMDLEIRSVQGSPHFINGKGTYQKTNPENMGSPYYEFTYFDWWPPDDNDNFAHSIGASVDYLAYGVPGEDENAVNSGAVIIVRIANDLRGSFCATQTDLSLVNFEKFAGRHPDIEAQHLSLGGYSFPANIYTGANINYQGKTVSLLPGFKAFEGSQVDISVSDCDLEIGNMLFMKNWMSSDYNIGDTNNLNTIFSIDIELGAVYKHLIKQHSSFPWTSVSFFEEITQIQLLDEKGQTLQYIKNPNPFHCYFNTKGLQYESLSLLINFNKQSFKVNI